MKKEKKMKIFEFIWVILWITGVVIAKGFWSTFFAIFTVGTWSIYLIIEKVLLYYGLN